MRAIVIDAYGGPDVLAYREVADPVPGPGDVLVRIVAAGVNPVDGMVRAGLTREYMPIHFPGILGWDISGTVEAVGANVSTFAPGDRVMAWADHGYAELVVVRAELLVPIPDGLDIELAAALPLPAVTGSQLISKGAKIASGERILVSGALGGVGRSAALTARDAGARVIAGVRHSQLSAAGKIDSDEVVDLDDEDALARLTPVDVVANMVRGEMASRLLRTVRKGGRFVSATGAPDNVAERPDIQVTSFVSKPDPTILAYVATAARDGRFEIPIGLRLPLARASDAHVALERGGAGKIVLIP